MAFVDNSKRIVVAQIQQIYMRYIETGQPAEIAFKMFPGKVYTATVESIAPGTVGDKYHQRDYCLLPYLKFMARCLCG